MRPALTVVAGGTGVVLESLDRHHVFGETFGTPQAGFNISGDLISIGENFTSNAD
jgi:hypothetical protein